MVVSLAELVGADGDQGDARVAAVVVKQRHFVQKVQKVDAGNADKRRPLIGIGQRCGSATKDELALMVEYTE